MNMVPTESIRRELAAGDNGEGQIQWTSFLWLCTQSKQKQLESKAKGRMYNHGAWNLLCCNSRSIWGKETYPLGVGVKTKEEPFQDLV